jgi:hypothetical protein
MMISHLCTKHPLTPGRFLVLIFVKGWVDPRVIELLEGLGKLKYAMTSAVMEQVTFWFEAYFLKQLSYRVPPIWQNSLKNFREILKNIRIEIEWDSSASGLPTWSVVTGEKHELIKTGASIERYWEE